MSWVALVLFLLVIPGHGARYGDTPVAADCNEAGESGQVWIDTNAPSGQRVYVCEGVAGWILQGDGGGAPAADSVGTSQLNDGADTPGLGECVMVDAADTAIFQYATCPGGAEVNDLEATDPPNVLTNEVYVGSGSGTGEWIALQVCTGTQKLQYTDAAPNTFTCVSEDATQAELDAQDECSEITGCVVGALTSVSDGDMATDDFGDFACGAGAEDCNLDTGVVDSAAVLDNDLTASDVAASLDTRKCFHLYAENIADTDEWVMRLPPFAGTMTRFDCEAYSGTSFTVNICDGEDIGDDTCATSVLGGTLVCDAAGANDITLSATGFAARDKVSIVVTAETGTPTGDMYMTCTVD